MTFEEFLIKRFGGESAFKDVQPSKETKLPDNAAEVWKIDKEKQIEEMAHIMGSRCMNTCPEMTCPKCGATSLYDAGYGNLAELKAENERIRQTSVTHETFKALMDEKDKEIKALKQAEKEMEEQDK